MPDLRRLSAVVSCDIAEFKRDFVEASADNRFTEEEMCALYLECFGILVKAEGVDLSVAIQEYRSKHEPQAPLNLPLQRRVQQYEDLKERLAHAREEIDKGTNRSIYEIERLVFAQVGSY